MQRVDVPVDDGLRPDLLAQVVLRFAMLGLFLLSGSMLSAAAEEPVLTEAESRRLLIDGEVLDSVTNEPIESFRVLPGVRYNGLPGARSNVCVWQPNMIRQMSNGVFQWPRTRGYDEMRFRIEADGYRAATTTWLGKGGPHLRMKVHLRPDVGVEGVVVSPNGSLASGAVLAIALPGRSIRLDGCTVVGHDDEPLVRLSDQWRQPLTVQTDQQGGFLLPYESDASAVLCVVHESGYLEESFIDWSSQIVESPDPVIVQLEPWAKVKGRVWWKDRPGQESPISLKIHRQDPYPEMVQSYGTTRSDDQGKFHFAHVPPGSVQISHVVRSDQESDQEAAISEADLVYAYPQESMFLKPGQTKSIDFGGDGVDVVGQLTGLDSYQNVTLSIRPPAPDVWDRQRFGGQMIARNVKMGYLIFQQTDYAPLYFREAIGVEKDGRFRIKDVMTGQYNVWVQGASGSSRFNLTGSLQNPLDLGSIKVQPAPQPPPK